jgi:Uma2 family endonuclease
MTAQQIEESESGDLTVCPFVVEVISKNDQINEVDTKLIEYFDNGVQVVWCVFPKLKKVEVYTSKVNVKICFGDTVCLVAPVMDDFEITPNVLFA